jgi:hypothetical protein
VEVLRYTMHIFLILSLVLFHDLAVLLAHRPSVYAHRTPSFHRLVSTFISVSLYSLLLRVEEVGDVRIGHVLLI